MGKKLLKFFKPTKKKVIVLCFIIAVAVTAVIVVKKQNASKMALSNAGVSVSEVTRGDVDLTITGSAAVEPYENYEILPPTSGDILSAPYEVGDHVEKGAILYTFDSSDLDSSLQKQENSLKKTEMSYQDTLKSQEKLTVTAPCDGVLSNLDVKTGDEVENKALIANIVDDKKLKVKIPFNESQIQNISLGQSAVLSSSAHMSSVTGSVTHIDANPTAQADGSMLYYVTVRFTNPGSFTKGLQLGAEINGMISPAYGSVEYGSETTISTEIDGTIAKVNYASGDYVKKGAVIVTITNDTIANDIKKSTLDYQDAVLSLQEKKDEVDNYNVTSPISGTVITKTSKAGDTIDKTNSTVKMMVVADISKLKFKLSIDELDVSKVQVGQQVEITADAIENETFYGEITEISMQGESANGVTTYTAQVTINEPGQLRPSMNVDATIIVESAKNVLRVDSNDIKTAMGASYVFVKDDTASTDKKNSDKKNGQKEKSSMSDMTADNTADKTADTAESGAPGAQGTDGGGRSKEPSAPDGFKTVKIEVGVKGDEYTEVISGLTEGQQIYQQPTSSSGSGEMAMMMEAPGGGGGPSGGGPGGGGPSGGRG